MRQPIPGISRVWLDRLLAALDEVYERPEEDWGGSWELGWLRTRITDLNLLTVRAVALRSSVLARITAAGEALSLNHLMKRVYANFRKVFTGLKTPFRDHLKPSTGLSIPWGGEGMYFDIVTQRKPKPFIQSKFWRDPFTVVS